MMHGPASLVMNMTESFLPCTEYGVHTNMYSVCEERKVLGLSLLRSYGSHCGTWPACCSSFLSFFLTHCSA